MTALPEGFPRSKEEQSGRVWVCKAGNDPCSRTAPCRSCLGRRNRRSGMVKQRAARKALEVVTGKQAAQFASLTSNEEGWRLPVRVEVKSGAQCNPVWTKFAATEAQANAAKSAGDARPFLAVFMGTRTSDGLVVCRLSELGRVHEALVDLA
jgi:hypothetical protein